MQERAQRARENRELRRLPPAQRAQRREDIRNAREERAKERVKAGAAQQPAQTPNRATLTPQQRRTERKHDGTTVCGQRQRREQSAAD